MKNDDPDDEMQAALSKAWTQGIKSARRKIASRIPEYSENIAGAPMGAHPQDSCYTEVNLDTLAWIKSLTRP